MISAKLSTRANNKPREVDAFGICVYYAANKLSKVLRPKHFHNSVFFLISSLASHVAMVTGIYKLDEEEEKNKQEKEGKYPSDIRFIFLIAS